MVLDDQWRIDAVLHRPVGYTGIVLLREAVVPQNVVRRGMRAAMIAKATQRTELGPSPALPTARHARAERAMHLRSAQRAQLTPNVEWDRSFGSGDASGSASLTRVRKHQRLRHRRASEEAQVWRLCSGRELSRGASRGEGVCSC